MYVGRPACLSIRIPSLIWCCGKLYRCVFREGWYLRRNDVKLACRVKLCVKQATLSTCASGFGRSVSLGVCVKKHILLSSPGEFVSCKHATTHQDPLNVVWCGKCGWSVMRAGSCEATTNRRRLDTRPNKNNPFLRLQDDHSAAVQARHCGMSCVRSVWLAVVGHDVTRLPQGNSTSTAA